MQVELISHKNHVLELEEVDRKGPNMDKIHEEVKQEIHLKLWADEQEQNMKEKAVTDKTMGKHKVAVAVERRKIKEM